MSKNKKHCTIVLTAISLILAALACSPPADGDSPSAAATGGPTVVISSPPSGTAVTVGEEVNITSVATASAGVDRVELSVSGLAVRNDAPPSGDPTSFSVVQAWMPETAGDVIVSVVAYDTAGTASEPVTIVLRVTAAEAEVMPTSTLSPEPAATATSVPDVTGGGGCTLNAAYVADVSIPDNTPLTPGAAAVKTWRIRNSGTCDWTSGFNLVFASGVQMGGETAVAVPATAAGTTVELSVHLTAPSTPGTYRGEWRMRSDTGTPFGSVVYVQIVVPGATDVPTKDLGPEPTKDATAEPTKTPTPTPTEEPPIEFVAPFMSSKSGSVGSDGTVVPYTVSPGDSADLRLFQGFVTFDISSLPNDAIIESGALGLGPCTEWGNGGVDNLVVKNYQYGNLEASDFGSEGTFLGTITSPCLYSPLDVTESVQAQVGQSYYQLRLQFMVGDLDDTADHYTFTEPMLIIYYR